MRKVKVLSCLFVLAFSFCFAGYGYAMVPYIPPDFAGKRFTSVGFSAWTFRESVIRSLRSLGGRQVVMNITFVRGGESVSALLEGITGPSGYGDISPNQVAQLNALVDAGYVPVFPGTVEPTLTENERNRGCDIHQWSAVDASLGQPKHGSNILAYGSLVVVCP